MASAGLVERSERDSEGRVVLTGLFDVHSSGADAELERAEALGIDAALEWAGTRASRIYVQVEGERFKLGPGERLPDDVAARLRAGRRRPAGDEWVDRRDDTPPVRWEIVTSLRPPTLNRADRAGQEIGWTTLHELD